MKTLHPAVHGGILARRSVPEHMKALDQHGIGGAHSESHQKKKIKKKFNESVSHAHTNAVAEGVEKQVCMYGSVQADRVRND